MGTAAVALVFLGVFIITDIQENKQRKEQRRKDNEYEEYLKKHPRNIASGCYMDEE